jgi:hypothetical protein
MPVMPCRILSAIFSGVMRTALFVCCLFLFGKLPTSFAFSHVILIENPVSPAPTAEDWLSTLGTALGPTLADAIRRGRDQAYPHGKAIPAAIRQKLAPFFSSALLQKVRYSTEWQTATSDGALYSLLLATGAEAVTLGEVIIFRDAQHAADPLLWAHELTHVEQYKRLGIPAFATQYLQQGWQMEQEARAKASKIQQQLAPY